MCPAGHIFVKSAQSCYNPTPQWLSTSSSFLIKCPEEGQFALEGDVVCRSCDEAEVYDIPAAVSCVLWQQKQKINAQLTQVGFSYARVVANAALLFKNTDWYGGDVIKNPSWDTIFNSGSALKFVKGDSVGHAPWGGEFRSYTYQPPPLDNWILEENPLLHPTLVAPGLWISCTASPVSSYSAQCLCSSILGVFDSEAGGGSSSSSSPWHKIRNAAFEAGAKVLEANSFLKDYVSGNAPPNSNIRKWSRFMILGSDSSVLSICAVAGPCFPVFKHVSSDISISSFFSSSSLYETLSYNNNNGGGGASFSDNGISFLKCSVGWPAHYSCPDGYMWVAPNSSSISPNQIAQQSMASQIACLSCLPGSFSALNASIKASTGGPYACEKCPRGSYSTAIGSSSCELCPSSTFSVTDGSTACDNCPEGFWTEEGAQTEEACSPCPPGSGNCVTCAAGNYQSRSAQIFCIPCPRGYVSSKSNQTTCEPCSINTYQDHQGMQYCKTCSTGKYAHQIGATTCVSCTSSSCRLVVNGVCGVGCGLNSYFDFENAACLICPAKSVNAFNPCASDFSACLSENVGKYVGPGNTVLDCPLGSTPNTLRNGCDICGPGTYSSNNSVGFCLPCPAGYISSLDNQSECTVCQPGTFAQSKRSTACSVCNPGYFSPTLASTSCLECPAAYYSDSASASHCTPCKNGTYSAVPMRINECDPCEEGGDWYSGSAATACVKCVGGYTNADHSKCVGCGLGMYNDDSDYNKCKPCPPGLVNLNDSFASNESACQPCPLGPLQYAVNGIFCHSARPGYIVNLQRTAEVPCEIGTFRNISMNTSSLCEACPAGYFNAKEAQDNCEICRQGTYSPYAGSTRCTACGLGLISSSGGGGGDGASACVQCPAGSITKDNRICTSCPPNFRAVQSRSCQACEENTISTAGSISCWPCPAWTIYSSDQKECVVCQAGYYMYNSGDEGFKCAACRPGLHNPLIGSNSSAACILCGNGLVPTSNGEGATGCMSCPAGHQEKLNVLCEVCSSGKFSKAGYVCTPCAKGTYTNNTGSSSCLLCQPGYYTNNLSQVQCTMCPIGTFSNSSGSTGCITCSYDQYNPVKGATSCLPRRTLCPEGNYILPQNHISYSDNACVECLPCPSGTYSVSLQTGEVGGALECPGDSTYPGYTCRKDVPLPGYYYVSSATFASSSSTSTTTTTSEDNMEPRPCNDLSAEDMHLLSYVAGPIYGCFVACKYGVAVGGEAKYIAR